MARPLWVIAYPTESSAKSAVSGVCTAQCNLNVKEYFPSKGLNKEDVEYQLDKHSGVVRVPDSIELNALLVAFVKDV